MENNIWLCIELFVIEFFVWFLIKKIFRLKVTNFQLLLSQICNIAIFVIYLSLNLSYFVLILMNFGSAILISLLIVNEYKFSHIYEVFITFIIVCFSIYGYFKFLIVTAKSLGFDDFTSKIWFDLVFIVCLIIYYILLYFCVVLMSKKSDYKNFYADVSFCLNGKHITLKGLIDSGNSVYDSESKKPVILISVSSLKKFMPLITFGYVCDVLASHYEKCVVVGGKDIYIPIVNVDDCKITKQNKPQNSQFVVGVVKQKFYDEKKVDCLIHKNFV